MNQSICFENIGPRERRRRLIGGVFLLGVAGLAAVWLLTGEVARPWRLLVFVPAWIGALDLLQVRERTCVIHAARGTRNMDGGTERVADRGDIEAARSNARRVYMWSAVAATAFTALVFAWPVMSP